MNPISVALGYFGIDLIIEMPKSPDV